ncbi:hypothetical protein [Sphingobacterium sp. UDSM-2020]|uniref:hypothetical protein n=1 Tax=Sphingobacterium sp. UDSM-2020 TaxID=2795738 RepID=UPI0019371163|nr:hypothetical protein [Sphingobacterium sp. UDSM-2020]QQD11819.1 hypothetical protein JAZ75_14410 [Sphingobacterium sp. UDSM-2020]
MGERIAYEQRSLNEVVRDTNGFVQKIDCYHAVAADMIHACNLLKGGRLRIVLKVPFEGKVDFEVSAKIVRRIKGRVMLQVLLKRNNLLKYKRFIITDYGNIKGEKMEVPCNWKSWISINDRSTGGQFSNLNSNHGLETRRTVSV